MKVSTICIIIVVVILASCNSRERKFNRELWFKGGDVGIYPERESMVDDLVTNHQLKGLQVAELRYKIGQPNEIDSTDNTLLYVVTTYYNFLDVDPAGSQILVFWFDKDSTITRYELQKTGKE